MTFLAKYEKIKNLAKDEIAIIEDKLIADICIKEPLDKSIKELLLAPSKRIRPLVAILYAKASGEYLSDKQLELLTIIELIHNASLIHDDIIDECKIRRGQKNISAKFDNKLAVIAGDYLLTIAMEKLTNLDNVQIIKKITQTIRKMCFGEINQNFDRYKTGTIEQYIEKTQNKTGYLFESALTCCMMLGNNNYDFDKISKFGMGFGVCFQIRDDILNFTETNSEKPTLNDVEEGIYNAPVIYGDKGDNYRSGIEKTKILLNNYIDNTVSEIKHLPENEYKKSLEELLELLQNV